MGLTLYVAQFVIAWLLLLAGDDITGSNIGGVLFGDVLVAVIVLIIGCLPKKIKTDPLRLLYVVLSSCSNNHSGTVAKRLADIENIIEICLKTSRGAMKRSLTCG